MRVLPLLLALLATTAGGLHAQTRIADADLAAAAQLRARALADDTGWKIVESLTTEVGPRPVGTPAMDRARDWGVAKLKELGFQNVKVETFTTPTWTRRGIDTAEVISPYPQPLHILALGRSASTPPGGLTAEIVLFRSYQDFLNQPDGSLKGKIAVVTGGSAGIGRAVAEGLAAEGVDVVLAARHADAVREAAARIAAAPWLANCQLAK